MPKLMIRVDDIAKLSAGGHVDAGHVNTPRAGVGLVPGDRADVLHPHRGPGPEGAERTLARHR
jgi:hypothetical protein